MPLLWWYKRSTVYATLPDVAAGLLFLFLVIALAGVVCHGYERPVEVVIRERVRRWRRSSGGGPERMPAPETRPAAAEEPARLERIA